MQLTPEQDALARLLFPRDMNARDELARTNGRFVHYTSAEVAVSILQNRSVWMRNALTMNDFREVEHGLAALQGAYSDDEAGGLLKSVLNSIAPGFIGNLETLFDSWLPHFRQDTFLTCLSEHSASEDTLGRLSMWRAYGGQSGVALVVNNTPFTADTNNLGAYSSAVAYLNPEEFTAEFKVIAQKMDANRALLAALPLDQLLSSLFAMLRFAVLATKHPGFKEEREWRIIYSPAIDKSKVITPAFATIRGIPQQIYQIPLLNSPENGLVNANISDLLDRLIIGPTTQPLTLYKTFVAILTEAGVQNAADKVFVSEIPLREAT
ncbi:DUF2971 domain-containing protein [Caulobacter sp. S45]|uniref:DUF2971 domain-containing protein n=1 Tax=Caulobacter sp. S45 TaxID=1641861 RepID=UPI00131B694C|nr:DUF2971 domain-containing protein [Caulobacter sp. S45]